MEVKIRGLAEGGCPRAVGAIRPDSTHRRLTFWLQYFSLPESRLAAFTLDWFGFVRFRRDPLGTIHDARVQTATGWLFGSAGEIARQHSFNSTKCSWRSSTNGIVDAANS